MLSIEVNIQLDWGSPIYRLNFCSVTQNKHLQDPTKTRKQVVNVKPIKLAYSLLSVLEFKRLLFAIN